MEFLAGVRVNDNHGHISVKQGVGAGARFLVDNPHLQIQEAPPGPYYKLSTPLDFTHAEVRDFVFSAVEELARTFDVDGIELCFRDHRYFPPGKGADSQPLMTELVRRVRRMLKGLEPSRGRKLLLGARVYQTLEECHSQGLDVPTWISEGLLDYVAPADVMHADFNAPYEQFASLARQGDCLVYPGVLPWSSVRMRRRLAENPLTPEQLRALAQNFYGAGADGVSFYNHFVPLNWAPSYPMMLFGLDELGDPERVAAGSRHYLFEPTWGRTARLRRGTHLHGGAQVRQDHPQTQRDLTLRQLPPASQRGHLEGSHGHAALPGLQHDRRRRGAGQPQRLARAGRGPPAPRRRAAHRHGRPHRPQLQHEDGPGPRSPRRPPRPPPSGSR